MKLKNISPVGALEVPLLNAIVDPDQVIDVRADHAAVLLLQRDNFAPVDKDAKTALADLLAEQAEPDEGEDNQATDDAVGDAAGTELEGAGE